MNELKKFFLLIRDRASYREDLVEGISEFLSQHGADCEYGFADTDRLPLAEDTDVVISLGGDGAFIRAAQRPELKGIPLIGLNLGHTGFLCELDEENVYDSLERLIRDDYKLEKRYMLEGTADINGEATTSFRSLNDVLLSRAGSFQITKMSLYVNGSYLYSYNCDGIIISTATGSTGYNLSAGGPIVDPKSDSVLVTPINAHALNARSIVLGADDELRIVLEERSNTKCETAEVRFDGVLAGVLSVGDSVSVKVSEETVDVIIMSDLSFLERVSEKLKTE